MSQLLLTHFVAPIGILLLIFYPGSILSNFFLPSQLHTKINWAIRLPLYCALSLASVSLLESVAFLSSAISHGLNWVLLTASIVGMSHRLFAVGVKKSVQIVFKDILPVTWPVLLIGLTAFVWEQFMRLPGPVPSSYGDFPSYYRVAHNLSVGARPLIDFQIGDYHTGTYFIARNFPVPMLVLALASSISLLTASTLNLISSVAGLMAILMAAGIVFQCVGGALSVIPIVTIGLLTAATLLLHLIMGSIVFLPLLFFMCLAWVFTQRKSLGKIALPLIAVFAIACGACRPEGTLLGSLAMSFFVIELLWANSKYPLTGMIATVLLAGATGFHLVIPSRIPSPGQSYSYLKHDDRGFSWGYSNVYDLNIELIDSDLGIDFKGAYNPQINSQIHDHPLDFLAFLKKEFTEKTVHHIWLLPYLYAILLLLVFSSWISKQGTVSISFAVVAYLPLLFLINEALGDRHLLPLALLVPMLTLGPILTFAKKLPFFQVDGGFPKLTPAVGYLVIGIFLYNAAPQVREAIRCIRTTWKSEYIGIFETVREHMLHDRTVASTAPQLISYALDTKAVGNITLFETLPQVIRKYKPDYILLDNARKDHFVEFHRYLWRELPTSVQANYEPIIEDAALQYVFLQRISSQR